MTTLVLMTEALLVLDLKAMLGILRCGVSTPANAN
jgi:hypothetical protein